MSMEFSTLELNAETGELLPAREALGLLKFNVANINAVNTATALNLFTHHSVAAATAQQYIGVFQR